MQVGALVDDGPAQRHDVVTRGASRLGFLARRVYLDVDVDLLGLGLGLDLLAAILVQQLGLLEVVDARDAPEVGDLGEVFAAACAVLVLMCLGGWSSVRRTRLQTADEVPLNGPRQQLGLLSQFLRVVLAKVQLPDWRFVQGKDVVGGLELRDGHETHLGTCQMP